MEVDQLRFERGPTLSDDDPDVYKGAVGVETLSEGLSEPLDTIEEVIEPI